MLPQLQAAGVKVMVVTGESPFPLYGYGDKMFPFPLYFCGWTTGSLSFFVFCFIVASPTKAAEFVEAQAELPMSAVFCSKDLAAYKSLGFYDNFGAALGARNAGLVPLEKIRARGEKGLKEMQDSVKNFGKVSPIGLVSGRPFAIEDAKVRVHMYISICGAYTIIGRGQEEKERQRFFMQTFFILSPFCFPCSL